MRTSAIMLIIFLIGVCVPVTVAQEEEATITSLSGHYSLMSPTGFITTTEPIVEEIQGLLPTEAITIADSEATLTLVQDDDFDLFDDETEAFEGVVVLSTGWPAGLLTAANLSLETFRSSFTDNAIEEGFEVEESTLELKGIKAIRLLMTKPERPNVGVLQLGLDEADNLYLQLGVASITRQAEIEAILDSLTAYSFTEESILAPESYDVPVEFFADTVVADVPLGWWVISARG